MDYYQQRLYQGTRNNLVKKIKQINAIRTSEGKRKLTALEVLDMAVDNVSINEAAKR